MQQTEQEEWRPIAGAEGYYSVSSLGCIRSEPLPRVATGRQRGRILKLSADTKGYLIFKLCVPGHPQRTLKAHRVVAQAFLGDPPDGAQVNHKNGDKSNNRIDNLEYVTCQENVRHCWDTGLHGVSHCMGEANNHAKLTTSQVEEIRRLSACLPISELATRFGVTEQNVWQIIKRKTWKHVG